MPIETVVFNITGANPQTKTVQVITDANGNGVANLQLNGVVSGTDSIQAVLNSVNGKTYTSNPAQVNWQNTNGDFSVGPVTSNFFSGSSHIYAGATTAQIGGPHLGNSLVYNEVINGFPIVGFVSSDGRTGAFKRSPMSQQQQNSSGQWTSDSFFFETTNGFQGNYTGSFVVAKAGTYTLYLLVDDSWVLFVGGGATRISGSNLGTSSSLLGLPQVGARLSSANPVQAVDMVVLNFPNPGIYPFEIGHANDPDAQTYLQTTYSPGIGVTPTVAGGEYGQNILPVATVLPIPPTAPSAANLQLTPSGGVSNLKVQGDSVTLTLNISGLVYTQKPYIPLLEGNQAELFITNDPVNSTLFNFQTYNGQGVTATAGLKTFLLSGDNGSWAGKLAVRTDVGSFLLNYNGATFDANVPSTLLTVTSEDISWYAAGVTDTFSPTSQGGGVQIQIEVDYLTRASVGSVSPQTIVGDGSQHTFVINLVKPLHPLQNSTQCNVSFSSLITVNSVSPNTNSSGAITGWTVVTTASTVLNTTSVNMTVTLSGSITYLKIRDFVTETVTYYNQVVAAVQVSGATVFPPSNVVFSAISNSQDAAIGGIGASTTLSCTVQSAGNNFGQLSFQYQNSGVNSVVSPGRALFVPSVGPTNIRQSGSAWLADYSLTALTGGFFSTGLYAGQFFNLGYIVTNTDGQTLTFWSPINYIGVNTPPTGGGGSGSGDGGTCFSGNCDIQTPEGLKTFASLPRNEEFDIVNRLGTFKAVLVVHEDHKGYMIALDLESEKLVTPEHAFESGDNWVPAIEVFPDYPKVWFEGTVYNLHILDENPDTHHYILWNNNKAHNVRLIKVL
jgi:hypothetical protein